MGYFQLKHIQRDNLPYVQLLVHQILYVIFETISHFSRDNCSVLLAQTLHIFDKSSGSKGKFSDIPLLSLKFTKSLMSFLEQRASWEIFRLSTAVMKINQFFFQATSQFSLKFCTTLPCQET